MFDIKKITPLNVLNFATFLQYQRFIMPISFLFYLQNGLNFSDFILFQSIFNITCLVAKIPMGFLGDLFSKKSILVFSYFLFLIRVILWLNFSGFWIILSGEVLYGLFKALFRGNVDSYIYEYLQKNNIEQKMLPSYGKLSFWTSLGSAISCFVGVVLYKNFGFKILLQIELITQIIAIIFLLTLPNIKTCSKKIKTHYLKSIFKSIKSLLKNKKINYNVFYSAVLNGLTSVFVWNMQPLLKACSAPVLIYGIINFINQILRGFGALWAKNITSKFSNNNLIKLEYIATLIAFILIYTANYTHNWVLVSLYLILICITILLYVVFNVYTISKIHEYTYNYKRATTSSTNTFLSDFSAFVFLLLFKLSYDSFGLVQTLIIFILVFATILYPRKRTNA